MFTALATTTFCADLSVIDPFVWATRKAPLTERSDELPELVRDRLLLAITEPVDATVREEPVMAMLFPVVLVHAEKLISDARLTVPCWAVSNLPHETASKTSGLDDSQSTLVALKFA
jgi:hypothetical protein